MDPAHFSGLAVSGMVALSSLVSASLSGRQEARQASLQSVPEGDPESCLLAGPWDAPRRAQRRRRHGPRPLALTIGAGPPLRTDLARCGDGDGVQGSLPLIPEAEPGGRPRKATTRELMNAILYFLRAGMAWRLLPHDLPPSAAGSVKGCGIASTTPC